jgi:hypothetical protein
MFVAGIYELSAILLKKMKNMKIILMILLVIIVIGFFWWKNKSKKTNQIEAPTEFVMLESKTETTLYIPILEKNWINETHLKYQNKEFVTYPNEYTNLSEKLCNDVYSKSKYWEKNKSHSSFLNELTKEQRIYFCLINFEAQVNNGGVYQFLFNYPELSIIALESMKVTKMDKLAKDYEIVLNEYFGKFKTIQELNARFQNNKSDWDERWNSFTEGYKELKSAEIIEDYFYNEKFVEEYQMKMNVFVKLNNEKLYKTE